MDEFIKALEEAAKKIQRFFDQTLTGILNLLESFHKWITAVLDYVGSYLVRLFNAIGKLLSALLKLGLFYLPGIIGVLIGLLAGIVWLLVLGVVWIVLITAIGLAYKQRSPTPSDDDVNR